MLSVILAQGICLRQIRAFCLRFTLTAIFTPIAWLVAMTSRIAWTLISLRSWMANMLVKMRARLDTRMVFGSLKSWARHRLINAHSKTLHLCRNFGYPTLKDLMFFGWCKTSVLRVSAIQCRIGTVSKSHHPPHCRRHSLSGATKHLTTCGKLWLIKSTTRRPVLWKNFLVAKFGVVSFGVTATQSITNLSSTSSSRPMTGVLSGGPACFPEQSMVEFLCIARTSPLLTVGRG